MSKEPTRSSSQYVAVRDQIPSPHSRDHIKACLVLGCTALALLVLMGVMCPESGTTNFMRGSFREQDQEQAVDWDEDDVHPRDDHHDHNHHPWGPPGPGKHHHHPWAPPGPGQNHHHPWGAHHGPGKHHHPWGPPPRGPHDDSDERHNRSSRVGGEPAVPHNGFIMSLFGPKSHHSMHSFSGSSSSKASASSSADSELYSEDTTSSLNADTKSSSEDSTSLSADSKSSGNIASLSSADSTSERTEYSKSSGGSLSSSSDTVPSSRKASEMVLRKEGLSEDFEFAGEMLPRRSLRTSIE